MMSLLSITNSLIFSLSVDCMAQALYFEARGEPLIGNMAVAQVILNRVDSRYYPDDVCSVVQHSKYPGKLYKCQFSYLCDGKPETIYDLDAWNRSKTYASSMILGNIWDASVMHSTLYYACDGPNKTTPNWDMDEVIFVVKIGNHCFYEVHRVIREVLLQKRVD